MSQNEKVVDYFDFPADEYDDEVFRWEEHHLRPGFARPVVVHRAVLGSVERFFSILLENCAGKWPFWLSPRQLVICPITDKNIPYCEKVLKKLVIEGFQASIDTSSATMDKKIFKAEKNLWNYILTVGKDEEALGMVDIRVRGGQ